MAEANPILSDEAQQRKQPTERRIAIVALAREAARNAVTRQIKVDGWIKLSQISNSTIRVYAKQYLAMHPELFASDAAGRATGGDCSQLRGEPLDYFAAW